MKKDRPPTPPRPPTGSGMPASDLTVREFQARIEAIYGARDRARGLATTFMWFAEEVGELSRALRRSDRDEQAAQQLRDEFADVFAWLVTLASIADVDLADTTNKYLRGCPRCSKTPCACPLQRPGAPTRPKRRT